MAFFKGFLIVIEVVSAALLVCLILVQKTKGGMGTAMGGMGEQVFGSRMGNVLTKATVWLVAIFLITTIIIARIGSAPLPESVTDTNPVAQPAVPAQPPQLPPSVQGGASLPVPPEAAQPVVLDGPVGDVPVAPVEAPAAIEVPVEVPVPAAPVPEVEAPAVPVTE
jgi:preprotein translocase subunit SecG